MAVFAGCVHAQPAMDHVRFLELTEIERNQLAADSGKLHDLPTWFTPYNIARPKVPWRMDILGDRREYLSDDPTGQFLVQFIGEAHDAPKAALELELRREGKSVLTRTISPLTTPKVALMLNTGSLEPGKYELSGKLVNVPKARKLPTWSFSKSAEARKVTPFPAEGVLLKVHAQSHVPGASWPMTTGAPLPRGAATSVDRFVLLENGKPVASQRLAKATWNPGDNASIKWMGLDFIARYQDGKPAEYRLKKLADGESAPAVESTLKVTESGDIIEIDTGAVKFTVNKRRFAGIERAELVGQEKPVIEGEGGPFLIDERLYEYKSSLDENVCVAVEEAGPVRVTIYATGWYTNDRNEKNCIFQTRISAYAGLPRIDVNHRTIITFDTDQKRLRALGFVTKTVGATNYRFGFDGKSADGAIPDKSTVFAHQDKFDHLRIGQDGGQAIAEGRKSDGWATATVPGGAVSLLVRNLWQLFPKEIEIGADQLTLHAWPKHGHVAYTEAEELDGAHIHKIRYAHQGKYLDLSFPQRYFDAFPEVIKALGAPATGGRFLEQQDVNALIGNAQGTAISNSMSFVFHKAEEDAKPQAALFQQNPHAITDPVYNGLTEVEGKFAGTQPQKFPELEKLLTEGYHAYNHSVDILEDYGMWIWPNTHNNWTPIQKASQGHRWWHNSHYQNVWEGVFLYWRSGEPWICDWARNNTDYYMNIATVNFDNPADKLQGKIRGANFHTKGFTPWGSARWGERTGDDYVEVGAHFIDPASHMLRYFVFGDPEGAYLMKAWGKAFERVALPPEASRECVTTLGEMVSYYQLTWDPQAIQYIHDLAGDIHCRPWPEIPAFPVHPVFHDRWVMLYWNLTRDPVVKQRVLEWFKVDTQSGRGKYGFPQLAALAWQWTGDSAYLTAYGPDVVGITLPMYDNPGDPLHGFGMRGYYFPSPSMGQMLPYYMQAMLDANLQLPPLSDAMAKMIEAPVTPEKDKVADWFARPKDWRYGAMIGYLTIQGDKPVIELELSSFLDTRYTHHTPEPCYFKITDGDDKVLLETSLLAGSQRPSAKLTLDGSKQKGPFKIWRSGTTGLCKWTGDATGVTLGPAAK